MKVLHIISGGDTGGAKTSVITLLKQLNHLMTIKLICFMEAEFSKYAREQGIDVLIMPQRSRWDLSVVGQLNELIHLEGYNLVNCHGARANFIGGFLKKHIDIPIVTTIHSDYNHDFDNSFYKKLFFTTLNRLSLIKMNGYITMAEKFKTDMVKRGFHEEDIFVTYNGIPMEYDEPEMNLEDFIKKYRIQYEEDLIFVGTASRLHPIKGVDVLLRAAERLQNINPKIKFLIAGTGDDKYTQKYKAFVKEKGLHNTVFFLGFVEEMILFFRLLDINIISSHSEAVCYALLEGGREKKPAIASRVGGTPELIENKKSGLLFEDNDDEALARLILNLSQKPELAEKLGHALYERVRERFSDEAMALKYKEIYQEILAR